MITAHGKYFFHLEGTKPYAIFKGNMISKEREDEMYENKFGLLKIKSKPSAFFF